MNNGLNTEDKLNDVKSTIVKLLENSLAVKTYADALYTQTNRNHSSDEGFYNHSTADNASSDSSHPCQDNLHTTGTVEHTIYGPGEGEYRRTNEEKCRVSN